jgi:hypothetical protein
VGDRRGKMQKWEYLTVTVLRDVILSKEGQRVSKTTGSLGALEGERLHDFLKTAGNDGWEVVGLSPITGGEGRDISVLIILKRPVDKQ